MLMQSPQISKSVIKKTLTFLPEFWVFTQNVARSFIFLPNSIRVYVLNVVRERASSSCLTSHPADWYATPQVSSGLIVGLLAMLFASYFAPSLPLIPWCPRTHSKTTYKTRRASKRSFITLERKVVLSKAHSAAWLLVIIRIRSCVSLPYSMLLLPRKSWLGKRLQGWTGLCFCISAYYTLLLQFHPLFLNHRCMLCHMSTDLVSIYLWPASSPSTVSTQKGISKSNIKLILSDCMSECLYHITSRLGIPFLTDDMRFSAYMLPQCL